MVSTFLRAKAEFTIHGVWLHLSHACMLFDVQELVLFLPSGVRILKRRSFPVVLFLLVEIRVLRSSMPILIHPFPERDLSGSPIRSFLRGPTPL